MTQAHNSNPLDLTEEETEDFFNRVKGKKIRWTGWSKQEYLIPSKRKGQRDMEGLDNRGNNVEYCVMNGFLPAKSSGNSWEYYQESPKSVGFEVDSQGDIIGKPFEIDPHIEWVSLTGGEKPKVECTCDNMALFNGVFSKACGYHKR